MTAKPGFYERLKAERARAGQSDSAEYDTCIQRTVEALNCTGSEIGPGLIAGEIQSGKMRTFLGVIALSFDKGFDITVVLTKGSKTPGNPMAVRIQKEFKPFYQDASLQVHDIMAMPQLSNQVLSQAKIVVVAKKEFSNLTRLLEKFAEQNEELLKKRILIIDDDDADVAAIRFLKERASEEAADPRIAQQIDTFRRRLRCPAFLQVLASSTTLNLQPWCDDYRAHAYAPEEFRLLVMHQLRVTERYKRPFTALRITFTNLDALRNELGATAAENASLVALHTIIGVLRAADFVGARGNNVVMVGLPETTAADTRGVVLDRIRQTVVETTKLPMELSIDLAEGKDVAAMFLDV